MSDIWLNLQNWWYSLTPFLKSSAIFSPITNPVAVFLIIMGIMLIAPLLFERFKLPGIVGLILAGVIVGPHGLNLLQRDSTIILLGTVGLLFLMFMAINPAILIKQPQSLLIAGVMILAEVVSKFAAAWAPGKLFRLQFPDIMVMFGLSVAQAASTLAAITVAYNIKLVDQATVNGIIAMILVTCIASPWITDRWGSKIRVEATSTTKSNQKSLADRILVPVANPNTEDNLLQLALILAKSNQGTFGVSCDRRSF